MAAMFIKANQLRDRGFPESSIRQMCHMEGSPFFQKVKGGTWWCDSQKFDRWIDVLAKKKEIEYG